MAYIKLLDVPLKCPRCGVTRVALGMGQNASPRGNPGGKPPTLAYDDRCPDCGDRMQADPTLRTI